VEWTWGQFPRLPPSRRRRLGRKAVTKSQSGCVGHISRRLRLGGKRNAVQCSVNNCWVNGCATLSWGGRKPIVNIATARFHGRSIIADSLAEGQSHRSLGQRPRTVDRPITIGWLKANLTIANGRDGRDSTNCRKMGPFESTQWVEVGLQPTKGRCFGNSRFPRVYCLAHLGRCPRLR
jgi:hypothetical protein